MRPYWPCALCVLLLTVPIAAFSESLDDYTLFSSGNFTVRDRARITSGLLGSNSYTQMGYDSALSGNVLSRGNMVMWDRALASGNVKLSGLLTLRSQAKVTGTVTQNASVSTVTIPTLPVTTGTADVTVGSGEKKTLSPADYRNVQVSSGGRLYLESGTYSFNTLTLGPDVILHFNCAGGPVDVRVLATLGIADRDRLIINQGSLSPSDVRIYSHQTTSLAIGTDGRIEAVLTAPRAGVSLGDRTILAGKLRANAVTIGYDARVNGSALVDSDGDGMPDGWEVVNGLNPNVNDAGGDPDGDGLDNGQEFANGTEPNNSDTDGDGIEDGDESATVPPRHTIHFIGPDGRCGDGDGDGVDGCTEEMYGLDPESENTLAFMGDRKYYELVNHMGEWAVSPTTSHLNPNATGTSAWILGANVSFGDDASTEMSIDRQMELSVFLPQDGRPITLKLDFVYDGAADPNDRFYDIKYSGAVYPGGSSGAPAMSSPVTDQNTISWKITDPLYYLKGDYFFNFSYHYDKNAGEQPRKIRMYAQYDDGTRAAIAYVVPVSGGELKGPLHFSLLVAGGDKPAYLRGETPASTISSTYIDNVVVTDFNRNVVRNIGKKAFNGYWFQYELGQLNACSGAPAGLAGCNRLEFDWVHDPATTVHRVIFALDETGNRWQDAQITYEAQYRTQDYFSWSGGLATDTAVLRKGKSFRVIATDAGLQSADAQVTIKNRAGADVTSWFSIHKESGQEDYPAYDGQQASWRENWIVDAPVTAPVGKYTIVMRNGSWTASTSFYLIYRRSEFSSNADEYDGYDYDEDFDGLALDTDTDRGLDLLDLINTGDVPQTVTMNAFTKTVSDVALAASEGKASQFEVRDAIRVFTNKLIHGCWDAEPPCDRDTPEKSAWGDSDDVLQRSGVTIAEVLAGVVNDAHLVFGDCTNFAQMSAALSRAIGIPSRMVTGRGIYKPNAQADEPVPGGDPWMPSTDTWVVHVWSEAWIENPPSGTDKWYVFDATDYMGGILGSSSSRLGYGALWMTPTAWADAGDETDYTWPRMLKSVTDDYKP